MTVNYKLQRSFAAGEISPLMYYRNDGIFADMHSQGLSVLQNMVPNPHGPAQSRQGSEFIEELEGEDFGRLFDMEISFTQSFAIVITSNFIYVLDKTGFQLDDDEITNGAFEEGVDGLDNWNSNQVTVTNGIAEMRPTGGQEAHLRQQLTVADPTLVHGILVQGNGALGDSEFTLNVGTAEGLSDIYTEQGSGQQSIITFTPGVGNAAFWIEIVIPSGGPDKDVDTIKVHSSVDTDEIIKFDSPYVDIDIVEMQTDKEPGNKTMFFVTRNVAPHELIYAGLGLWIFQPVPFTYHESDPAPWGNSHPGSISFFSGRMVLGGTFNEPVGVWLSKPQKYRNFDLGEPGAQVDDDALFLPLDKHGNIVWLLGNKVLFIGLDTGEHIIFGEGGVLTPANAQTEQHSTYGSARIQAVISNEEVTYVDSRGRKVRIGNFDSNTRKMSSFDVSFISEHITEGRIRELGYGTSPLGTLFMPTIAGDFVICNIEKDRGIYGWSHHQTQGDIVSTVLLKEFGIDVPWVIVKRYGRLFVERMNLDTRENSVFIDNNKSVEFLTLETVFPGFEHLAEQSVQIIADGAVRPDVIVAVNGDITLESPAFKVIAGLGFTARLRSIPTLDETQQGSTIFHEKRYSTVAVGLINCARPIVNGQDTYRRSPETPMDEREPDRTEIIEVTDLGWDQDAFIDVSQPLALNLVVSAIGGKLKSNKL